MALSMNLIMTWTIIALTPVLIWFFGRKQRDHMVPILEIPATFFRNGYYIHGLSYWAMVGFKGTTDKFNEPLKGQSGDYTSIVHAIEGDITLYIQRLFEFPLLTQILNFHYLFIYLFIIVFTTVYYMMFKEKDLADKAIMNYVMIYVLAVPYYLFFNVEVTSSFIPGMKALLYHDSARYYEFFTTNDPLDNAFPSLHTAIPWGILFLNWITVREKGIKMRDWRHFGYHRFVFWNTMVFMFSILYLGIHWISDIATGMMLAFIGALFVHAVQPKLRAWSRRKELPKLDLRKIVSTTSMQTITSVLLIGMLMFTLQYQENEAEVHPNFRLGAGDVNVDVFEPISEGESIKISVSNLHPNHTAEGVLLPRTDSISFVSGGQFNWTTVAAETSIITFNANSTTQLVIDQPDTWFVLLMHNPRVLDPEAEIVDEDPATLRIRAVYPGNVVPQAVLLSTPSLLATTYVLHRQMRLWVARQPWYSSKGSREWLEEPTVERTQE